MRSHLSEGDLTYSNRRNFGDIEMIPKELRGVNLTQNVARSGL